MSAEAVRSGVDEDRLAAWARAFEARWGRAPRVLHIGNIANNAYLNAKILREYGVESHVACYDYYHIMGCPEWEEADVETPLGEGFHPWWPRRELGGFRRPRWFAQGPRALCIAYLEALCDGAGLRSWLLWRGMELYRMMRAGLQRRALGRRLVDMLGRGVGGPGGGSAEGALGRIPGFARRIRALPWPYGIVAVHAQRLAESAAALVLLGIGAVLAAPFHLALWLGRRGWPRYGLSAEELARLFGERFPDREALSAEEARSATELRDGWSALCHRYDAVVGYATDGLIPLVCATRPFFAYEHGTIRSLPFTESAVGKLCALTYRMADSAFITNCDNRVAAEALGLEGYRFVPHPVNETVEESSEAERLGEELRARLGCRFLLFHPSRQHWEERRHPDWEKGNDVLIRGFAAFVRDVDGDAGAVFVEWGSTVAESKRLLDSLGVAERVLWISPQANRRMVRYIRACDVLADQFYLGAFGSTLPKALLHGRPAMLKLDEARHEWCFSEMPPVLNTAWPEDVRRALLHLYREPEFARDLARRGRKWYHAHHSSRRIAAELFAALSAALEASASTGRAAAR